MDDVIVDAPRTYSSILMYNKKNTPWYNTQIKIKMDLEAEKMLLMEEVYNLQSNMEFLRTEHNRIKQEVINTERNLSLDLSLIHI